MYTSIHLKHIFWTNFFFINTDGTQSVEDVLESNI